MIYYQQDNNFNNIPLHINPGKILWTPQGCKLLCCMCMWSNVEHRKVTGERGKKICYIWIWEREKRISEKYTKLLKRKFPTCFSEVRIKHKEGITIASCKYWLTSLIRAVYQQCLFPWSLQRQLCVLYSLVCLSQQLTKY